MVLLRHSMAPGAMDPANFDIAKCSTQRNLSERGKQQARKVGALFAARAAPTERVLTSRYCRARQTARLAFGAAEEFPPLEPPAADEAEREKQLKRIVEEEASHRRTIEEECLKILNRNDVPDLEECDRIEEGLFGKFQAALEAAVSQNVA